MDGDQDVFDTLLQNLNLAREAIFSANTLHLVQKHVLSPSSPINLVKNQILSAMASILDPLAVRLNRILVNSPDIVILLLVVLVFVLAVQILAWIRRLLLWITGLVFRLMFWSAVIAGVAWVYQRGPEATMRDGVVLVSKIAGYGASLRDVWLQEYQRYDHNGAGGSGAGAHQQYGYSAGRGR